MIIVNNYLLIKTKWKNVRFQMSAANSLPFVLLSSHEVAPRFKKRLLTPDIKNIIRWLRLQGFPIRGGYIVWLFFLRELGGT